MLLISGNNIIAATFRAASQAVNRSLSTRPWIANGTTWIICLNCWPMRDPQYWTRYDAWIGGQFSPCTSIDAGQASNKLRAFEIVKCVHVKAQIYLMVLSRTVWRGSTGVSRFRSRPSPNNSSLISDLGSWELSIPFRLRMGSSAQSVVWAMQPSYHQVLQVAYLGGAQATSGAD